jgi:hypothetical protein
VTGGANAGRCITVLSTIAGRPSGAVAADGVSLFICSTEDDEVGVPLINRCLSSPSLSSSLSNPSASNVSAKVRSTTESCLEPGEEARDRKEGGGDVGVVTIPESVSSFPDTYQ